MTRYSLSVRPRAERQTQNAVQWYEKESQGLGTAFLKVVEQALQSVVENPLRFPVVYRDVRRALLKRFPYGLFFRVGADRITVISVIHLSRDPIHWQRRR